MTSLIKCYMPNLLCKYTTFVIF